MMVIGFYEIILVVLVIAILLYIGYRIIKWFRGMKKELK